MLHVDAWTMLCMLNEAKCVDDVVEEDMLDYFFLSNMQMVIFVLKILDANAIASKCWCDNWTRDNVFKYVWPKMNLGLSFYITS